ncbi:MAG: hypothetical protein HY402_05935 [Elusimicrobia bacterium]|nr:hypothetical protein [Elusimicrobiota bacterium]
MDEKNWQDLPAGDWIAQGLKDLVQGLKTVPSLLVSIGAPKLKRKGISVAHTISQPELELYALLKKQNPDAAHSRYNALLGRLVSFEHSIKCEK